MNEENTLTKNQEALPVDAGAAGSPLKNRPPMQDQHNRVTAILEYSPRLKKAFIRAVLDHGEHLPPLEPENTQNHVNLFFGTDHKYHVGISPLVFDDSENAERTNACRERVSKGEKDHE